MTLDTHCQVAEGQTTAAYQLIYYENKSYDIHSIIFTYIIFSLSALIFEHVFLLQNSFWSISWTLSWIMTKVKKKNWGFNIKVFLTIIFHLYVLSMYVHLSFFNEWHREKFQKTVQYQLSALGRGEWVISYWQLHFCCEKEKSFDLLAARSCRCIISFSASWRPDCYFSSLLFQLYQHLP